MITLPARVPVPAVGRERRTWTVPDDGLVSRSARARGTGEYVAAVPARLSDVDLVLDSARAAEIAHAESALARFDLHTATTLGSDHGALGPMSAILLRTESASSSQIEDLTLGARQLALAELRASTSANARLVVGNVRAMEAALALSSQLDTASILAMHRALMEVEGSPGRHESGRVRSQLVWVGRSGVSPVGAAFVAPECERVPAALEDLEALLARDGLPVLAHTAIAHAQFETIHPFIDGNGRTGRALVHAMLRGKGLMGLTTAPVSAGLLTDVRAYTSALTAFREGDAGPIIDAFTSAARFAAVSGARLVDDLSAELEGSRERLSELRPQAMA